MPKICRRAYTFHLCYHYAGKVTAGEEAVSERGYCRICEVATPPYEEAPSFMRNEENE